MTHNDRIDSRYSRDSTMNPLPVFTSTATRRTRFLATVVTLATYVALCAGGLLGGCATAPPARPPNRDMPEVIGKLTPAQAQDVTLYAMNLVGTPYRYGGNTPEGGFDCSGLIGHVYQTNAGLVPPRTTAKLQSWGKPVPVDQVRMGDLVVFLKGDTANHAGIYVGSGRFVHAPSSGGVVRLDSLTSKYWAAQPLVVRRP